MWIREILITRIGNSRLTAPERRLRLDYVCINSLSLVQKMAPLEELASLSGAAM